MSKKIILYGSKDCPWTEKIQDILEEKQVSFDVIDVVQDYSKRTELVKKSGHYVLPVIDIKGTIVSGYDEKGILKALIA